MWRYAVGKQREALVRWFVWRLPRDVILWAVIRVWAHATTGRWGNSHPDAVGWNLALKRWEQVPDNRRVMRHRYPEPVE